jgi:hypothetical protein
MEKGREIDRLQSIKACLERAGFTPEDLIVDFEEPGLKKLQMKPWLINEIKCVKENWDLIS